MSDYAKRRHLVVLASLGLTAVAIAVSCGGRDRCADPVPEVTYPGRQSPDNLLSTFCLSLERKDIAQYAACLDTSFTFTFYYTDWQAAGVSDGRPFWTRSQDLDAMGRLFADPHVGAITCTFDKVVPYVATDKGFFCSVQPAITLTINGEAGADPQTKRVTGCYLDIEVGVDPGYPGLWTVHAMHEVVKESVAADCAVPVCTFGSIKALFRVPAGS